MLMASLAERTGSAKADRGAVASVWWSALTRLRQLLASERSLLLLLLAGVGIAGSVSFGALFALADGDTPVSSVPLVPLMGAVFLLRRFDGPAIRKGPRDGFVDGIVLAFFSCATAILLFLLPVIMSWDYWLDRLDIPGLVALLTTLVVAVWGLPGLVQLGPALLYCLLAWPLPYLLVYNHLIPTLTDMTAQAVRAVAPLLPLGIQADPGDVHSLLVSFHGQTSSIIVAQSCAGMNGALGLAVIGLPIALLGRGSWEARGMWLAFGIVLSWLVNVLRILVIVALAAVWGPGVTMAFVHPELGLILFGLSFALLLWLAPLCHLDVGAPWHRAGRRESPAISSSEGSGPLGGIIGQRATRPARGMRTYLSLAAVLIVAGLFDSNLGQFRWVSEAALPRVGIARADRLFALPAHWSLSDAQAITGWEPLFGPSTVASVLTVSAPGRVSVDVQAVLTRDVQAFSTYGVEDCYTFHGYTLQSVHHVPLGNGVTASLIDFRAGNDPVATLYWIQPVQTPEGLYHERIVLIRSVPAARQRSIQALAPDGGVTNPVQQAAIALEEFLTPWVGGSAGVVYQQTNTELMQLGRAEIAWERHSRA